MDGEMQFPVHLPYYIPFSCLLFRLKSEKCIYLSSCESYSVPLTLTTLLCRKYPYSGQHQPLVLINEILCGNPFHLSKFAF